MAPDDHPREQTILLFVCTAVVTTFAPLGVSRVLQRCDGLVCDAVLIAVSAVALAVPAVWWFIRGRWSRELVSGFTALVVRRRFALAVACMAVAAVLNSWPRPWPAVGPSTTRLTLVFTGEPVPREWASSNVRWSSWSGLEPDDDLDRGRDDGAPRAESRRADVRDVTVIFLRFDAPVDCESFTLATADWSVIPRATTHRTDKNSALVVIHGRIKRDVEITIEPARERQA